jgi:hypothetical protein
MWVRRGMTAGLMTRFMAFSKTDRSGPVAEMGPSSFILWWTNVAALPVHFYGMRTVGRSGCDLPDLPISSAIFACFVKRLGLRLEAFCVLLRWATAGVHWPSRSPLEAIDYR